MRGRQRFRKERSVLLWGLAVFAALQLGLALSTESWLPEVRDPQYGAKIKLLQHRTAAAAQPPLTVVMLGSSRTAFGFEGKLLEGPLTQARQRPAVVFNFGVFGAGPLSELAYLRNLLAEGIRPDLLLVEVLPKFLDDQTELAEMRLLPGRRLGLHNLALAKYYDRSLGKNLYGDWWRSAAVPSHAHRRAILSQILPVLVPSQNRIECFHGLDDSGWLRLPATPIMLTPEQRRLTLETIRRDWQPALARLRPDGRAGQVLRDLLTLGRREGIAMALVLMPEGPFMRDCYSIPAWQGVYTSLQDLSHEFGCPLVNAREWIAEEDFVDSHHLLPHGAALFTERLGREAILPLFSGH